MRHLQHWYFPQFRCHMRKISVKRYRRAKLEFWMWRGLRIYAIMLPSSGFSVPHSFSSVWSPSSLITAFVLTKIILICSLFSQLSRFQDSFHSIAVKNKQYLYDVNILVKIDSTMWRRLTPYLYS